VVSAYEEKRLVDALRNRDEAAFASLVDRYASSLTRVARLYVRSRAVADEVVQETWLGVIEGISRFDGRSSLNDASSSTWPAARDA
jgi:RNA polymerase sigma-70 factor, ECF subfamily